MNLVPFRRLVVKSSLVRIALGSTLLYWLNSTALGLTELVGIPAPTGWWDLSVALERSYPVLLILTAVLFLIWSYSAHANLARLGRDNIRHQNQATIWWWIVPFANFVVPYRVMGETARGSLGPLDDRNWPFARLPRMVGWWTALFLSGQLVHETVNNALATVPTTELAKQLAVGGVALGSLLLTGAAATAIVLITRVTDAQVRHAGVPTVLARRTDLLRTEQVQVGDR